MCSYDEKTLENPFLLKLLKFTDNMYFLRYGDPGAPTVFVLPILMQASIYLTLSLEKQSKMFIVLYH